MTEEFKLYYKDILIGTVLTDDTDFPNISGHIELDLEVLYKQKELLDYIAFSIMSSEKVLGDSDAYQEFIDKEEFKHTSFIDSFDWSLVSKDGVKTKILVPVFLSDKGINLRFQ